MKTRRGWLVQRGKKGTYHAVWEIGGKRFMKSTGQTTVREARKVLDELMEPFLVGDTVKTLQHVKAEIERGKDRLALLEEERDPPLTLDQAWTAFDQSPGRPDSGERTLAGYKAEFERFRRWMAKEHPGSDAEHPDKITLRDIGPSVVMEYAKDLNGAKVSASTFNQHVKLLSLMWRVLSSEIRGEGANPWAGIARKRINPLASRKKALTPAQFDALLAAAEADPELRDLIHVLSWTGLRLVDGVKLRWGAVDFARKVISLAPQKTARRTGKTVMIPMFPALQAVLDRRQDGKVLNPTRFVFPELVEDYDRDNGSALVKRLGALFEKAGMATAERRAGQARAVVCYGAHSLRHHFVTAAAAAGVPAAMIKAITGHSTDAMLEHYQHIGAELATEIGRRIGTPSVPSKETALLPATGQRFVDGRVVLEIAKSVNARNWKSKTAELVQLVSRAGSKEELPL